MYELSSKLEFQKNSMVDKNQVSRMENKIRDLETKLDLEQTTRQKVEVRPRALFSCMTKTTNLGVCM